MQTLSVPYRKTPADSKCYFHNETASFFHALHQQNLFWRHYMYDPHELLSVLLICRTLALPGDWHRRINPAFLNITYVHSGETSVRIGNRSFLAGPGDLILFPPGTDYEFGSCGRSVRSGIVVQGSVVAPALQQLRGKYVFPAEETGKLLPKIERFFQEDHIDGHQLAVWSFDLLSSLKNNDSELQLPDMMHRVIQKMQNDLDMPLKLELLAAEAGVSPRTLSRMFKKYFQLTPHKYLIKLRMQRACQMLTWEEFSIKETAISAGYTNALNFSTEFKRIMGCSPTEYRMRGHKTDSCSGTPEIVPAMPEHDVVI